ncbi:hypothetical protein F7725_026812 [Dissostichus mawsoni]|uniref:Uncharacterized protein n=1 Tax=Dissostichus mawsoni TaxID=36200 RepID=A0A7J5X940_DISMA|nr:hypothetical protein F7725_026812 [Dissostichus mawsoni]
MMLPYTSTSLKRKKTLGCGPRRLSFISRPSPIRTRPGWDKAFPDGPNEFSTAWIRSRSMVPLTLNFLAERSLARCSNLLP